MKNLFNIEGPMRLVLCFVIVVSGMFLTSLAWGTIPVTFLPFYPLGLSAVLGWKGVWAFSGYVILIFCLVAVLFARDGYPLALSVFVLIVAVALTTKGCIKGAEDWGRVASLEQSMREVTFESPRTRNEQSIRTSRAMTTPTSRPVSMISHSYNTNPVTDVRPRW